MVDSSRIMFGIGLFGPVGDLPVNGMTIAVPI
jgi:hypothetical protein